MRKVEGKRCGRQIERLADRPGGQAFGSCLDQQPKYLQARVVRESGKGINGFLRFHISRIVEMKTGVNSNYW